MASEQFSLCWDNFHSNMSNGLSSLLRSEDLVDVTLAAEGRQLKAHKMVLSVCSPYFRELFQSSPCKHPIVFLKDVSFSALSNLMEFMYQGEVKVSQDELGTFIKTAEQLKIKGLTGDSQNHTDTDSEVAALNANTSSRERDSPLPVSRKMAREKSPPARKKMLGPASKRFKSSEIELSPIPSTQPIKTRQSEPRQTESTTRQQQQHESSSSRLTADRDQSHSDTDFETKEVTIDQQQLMQFKMEPDDANASVPIDDDLQYDDSTMDDMTMDSTTDYMMDPSDVSLTGKEMKPGTSSAMDNPEQAGENQEMVNIVIGARGVPQLVLDNYLFIKNCKRGSRQHWKCIYYNRSRKCKATLLTEHDELWRGKRHNHVPNVDILKEKKKITSLVYKVVKKLDNPTKPN